MSKQVAQQYKLYAIFLFVDSNSMCLGSAVVENALIKTRLVI